MMGELHAGDPRLVGPYRLLGRLGSGGMGQVFLGRSAGGRLVAVKVIRPDLGEEPGFRTRFAREVAAARNVSGLFTALVVDADVEGPMPWLATAYVPGLSLNEAVASQGPLPVDSVVALAAGLAEGLQAIHAAGVVHRDLKPSNVLLADDGPRVIDFGISRAAEATMLTQSGAVIGSPGFMSPEQAEAGEIGPPSDVFSLGAVLTFAATGECPFGSGSIASMLYRVVHIPPDTAKVPARIRPVIERCLAKDPRQRPTPGDLLAELGAGELAADWLPPRLTEVVSRYASPGLAAAASPGTDSPLAASTPGPPPTTALGITTAGPSRPGNRRRLAWVAAAAAVIVAASASAALAVSSHGGQRRGPTGPSQRPSVAASASARPTRSSSPTVSPTTATSSFAQSQPTSGQYSPTPTPTSTPTTSPTPTPTTTPTTTSSPTPTATTSLATSSPTP